MKIFCKKYPPIRETRLFYIQFECIFFDQLIYIQFLDFISNTPMNINQCGFQFLTRIHWLDRRIVRERLDIMATYYYVQNQGKLLMQTKNLNLGIFLTISRPNISKLQIFLKKRFYSNLRSYLVLTSGQKPKKSLKPFLRKISKCLILGWRLFFEYL